LVESVKPIRTALRTLTILAELNIRAPASAAEIAKSLAMSRATTYRFLETLVDAGFVVKNPATGHYSPTHMVRTLSCGYEDESWLVDCAKPIIGELGQELVWPIAIATIAGPGMLLRESTDMDSPLAINRFTPGRRVSLVGTATGLVYLAFCGRQQRETLLDILGHSDDPDDLPARNRPALRKQLAEIRKRQFATAQRTRRLSNQNAIAVPVLTKNTHRVLASLSIRYSDTAVKESVALARFLPRLQQAAQSIGESFGTLATTS
jgi:IclR family mhp operon transcriptional activator